MDVESGKRSKKIKNGCGPIGRYWNGPDTLKANDSQPKAIENRKHVLFHPHLPVCYQQKNLLLTVFGF